MASLKDVAKLANVSLMTVSRALNSPERLKAETLARVQAAIEQTNYVPDLSAKKNSRRPGNAEHHRRAGAGYGDHSILGRDNALYRRDGAGPRLEQLCG